MTMNPDDNPPDRLAGADDMFDGLDDILADAVRQWRAQPVADGPGPVALARTVERTRAAARRAGGEPLAVTSAARRTGAARAGADAGESSSSSSRFALFRVLRERFAGTSPWLRFAAAAVLVLSLVGGMMLFTEHKAVAFADVKRQIQEARSLTYKMRMEQGDKADRLQDLPAAAGADAAGGRRGS